VKRIAVVGFGFMGVTHARWILSTPGLELCGIVSSRGRPALTAPTQGNLGAQQLPADLGGEVPFFANLGECAREQKLDAVSICVPLHLHYQVVKQALELGLDVLVEKPFCADIKEGSELISLARECGLILMVAHCVRFAPEWAYLADCVRQSRFGKLKVLSLTRMGGVPNWGAWTDPKVAATCGGSLMDLLIHDIDFANSILGVPSRSAVNFHTDEFWDISLSYSDSPALVSVKGGFLHKNSPFSSECVAIFETASIRFSSMQPGLLYIGSEKRGLETMELPGDAYAAEIAYLAQCIEHRKQPLLCMPEESLLAVEICQKMTHGIERLLMPTYKIPIT
jgi:predicted dehydrogenase